jgi:hypothetical protein
VARGRAPSSRLARRSRRGHPMPAAARRYPAGPQTPGTGWAACRAAGCPAGDHRAGDEHGRQGHAPGGDGCSPSARLGLGAGLLAHQPACHSQCAGRPWITSQPRCSGR